jgi:hypothetical protein
MGLSLSECVCDLANALLSDPNWDPDELFSPSTLKLPPKRPLPDDGIYRGGTGGFTIFDPEEEIVYTVKNEVENTSISLGQYLSQSSDLVSVCSRLIDFNNSFLFQILIFMACFFSIQKKQVTNQHL